MVLEYARQTLADLAHPLRPDVGCSAGQSMPLARSLRGQGSSEAAPQTDEKHVTGQRAQLHCRQRWFCPLASEGRASHELLHRLHVQRPALLPLGIEFAVIGRVVGLEPEGLLPGLEYAWTQTGGATVTLSAAALTTFAAPTGLTDDAVLTFALRVTDAGGLYGEDQAAVMIVAPEPQGLALTTSFHQVPAEHDGALDHPPVSNEGAGGRGERRVDVRAIRQRGRHPAPDERGRRHAGDGHRETVG